MNTFEEKKLFNNLPISNISSKLEEKIIDINYPLEEYLKDDEAVQCYKNMNKNTKKYFTFEKVKKLISYITQEPDSDDYLIGHRYPYISYEILKTECPYIQDLFVLNENEYNYKYKLFELNENKIEKEKNIDQNNKNLTNINIKVDENIIKNDNQKNIENLLQDNKIEENNKEINNNLIKDLKRENNENLEKKNIIHEDKILKNEIKDKNKNKENKSDNESKNENTNYLKIEKKKELLSEKEVQNKLNKININNETDIKIEDSNHNEFLDLLLNFVTTGKKELNYVLSGYFSDILMTLIDKYPTKILKYLYTIRKDALNEIINHSHQKSFLLISAKLLKILSFILHYLNDFQKEYDENNIKNLFGIWIKYRNRLIENLIFSLTLEGVKDEYGNIHNDYDIENIFSLLYDLISEDNILNFIVKNPLIYNYIFNILDKKITFNYTNNEKEKYQQYIYSLFIQLLIKIIGNINIVKEGFEFPNDSYLEKIFEEDLNNHSTSFITLFIITFSQILINNFVDIYSKNILGTHNIYIMELIYEIFIYMKEAPFLFDILLIQNNFIKRSINYFFKYQWNNIYHSKFIKLFKLYLDNESKHEKITFYLFYTLKFHEILSDYIINEELIIEGKDNQINKNELNNKEKDKNIFIYKNKYFFKSGIGILSGVYSYVIELMYIIQTKSGLKIFDKKELEDLNIKNLGEFEFIKDEKSKNESIQIQTSEILNKILKLSNKWNYAFEYKVLPLIKKYEGKLYYNENKINKNNKKSKDLKSDEFLEKYNDVNFWEVKLSLSNIQKNNILKNNEKEFNNNNINNKKESNLNEKNDNELENNEIENKFISDEEDELLGIAMRLEQNEKKGKIKKSIIPIYK